MPGGYMGTLYDGLYDSKSVKPILIRHEQVASIMAEIYGRLTGKPGVFTAQGAWSITNGAMGALEALQGCSPMIILTDMTDNYPYSHQGSYQVGTGEYGGYDVKKVMDGITKYVTVAYGPEQAVQSLQLVAKQSLSGNQGPTALIFHSNAINGKVTPESSPKIYHTSKYLVKPNHFESEKNIAIACERIMNAEKPIIIAGNGVHNAKAYYELQLLAELTGAPVTTTAQGKSTIAETHPNAVGVMGNWGQDVANEHLSKADVLLVVGSKLAPTDTCNATPELINPSRQTIIQIDIEPKNASWTFPVDQSLIGDAKNILSQMIDYMKSNFIEKQQVVQERIARIEHSKKEIGYMECEEQYSNATPILPQRVVKEIESVIDENTIVTLDAGENRVYNIHYLKTKSAGSLISPASAGGMGYSIPAALATKLVNPERKVLSICGDGGFPMTMNGLMTSLEYNLPIVVVIMNNSALGWVKNAQEDRVIASTYPDYNFSEIARSFGCNGVKIDKAEDLAPAIEKAFETGKTTVIDVVTSNEESYKKIMSKLAKSLED
ncbi:hypothetical protein BTR23_14915 [Alkalihalophilus pseudofirmus]|nr:hypothetical protein BTR23_14915 [Alkalihalophilus pseudofirmus]